MDIDSFLPESMKGKYEIKRAHLCKIGYVASTRSGGVIADTPQTGGQALRELAASLYDVFEQSPNVLEIQPPREKGVELGASGRVGPKRLSLLAPLELRVALSEQQRRDYRGAWSCPEQLTIAYDGALFFAWSEVTRLPQMNGVGQAAREFLKVSLSAQGSTLKVLECGGERASYAEL